MVLKRSASGLVRIVYVPGGLLPSQYGGYRSPVAAQIMDMKLRAFQSPLFAGRCSMSVMWRVSRRDPGMLE